MTFLLSAAVTALVAVPLWLAAASAEEPAVVAPVSRLIVSAEGAQAAELNGTLVSGEVKVSYLGDGVDAVAFSLLGPDGLTVERVDGEGPNFDLFVDDAGDAIAFDTTRVPNGEYRILASIRQADQTNARTAAIFTVDNSL